MKELFNKLSKVFQFFKEKHLVHQDVAKKQPEPKEEVSIPPPLAEEERPGGYEETPEEREARIAKAEKAEAERVEAEKAEAKEAEVVIKERGKKEVQTLGEWYKEQAKIKKEVKPEMPEGVAVAEAKEKKPEEKPKEKPMVAEAEAGAKAAEKILETEVAAGFDLSKPEEKISEEEAAKMIDKTGFDLSTKKKKPRIAAE